jgi:hypothetical protein
VWWTSASASAAVFLADQPPDSDANIPFIPWLVLMREEA